MKKILISIIAVFVFAVLLIPQNSYAMTPKEIVELINQLKKQIKELERQLSEAGGIDEKWCYDFNKNLKTGDKGKKIDELNNALVKEGVLETGTFEHSINFSAVFGKQTTTAVIAFQEKYADEILRPLGLRRGTGYVGVGTRKVLNRLYGCKKQVKPSITVISPNGGENIIQGAGAVISWKSNNISLNDKVYLVLSGESPFGGGADKILVNGSCDNIFHPAIGSFSWDGETVCSPSGHINKISVGKFRVEAQLRSGKDDNTILASDGSDKLFNIITSN